MGGAIDKTSFVDHGGKRVYLCCDGCKATFKKDPAKYLKKLEEMGQKPEKI
jgi:YHS domain-containing protein